MFHDIQSAIQSLNDHNQDEINQFILSRLNIAKKHAYLMDRCDVVYLTLEMHLRNQLTVVADLISADHKFDEEIVSSSLEILNSLLEIPPELVLEIDSKYLQQSLKSQLSGAKPHLITSVT